jgi:hypothetical protein
MTIYQIIEQNPYTDFLIADGFDDAIIGYETNSCRIIYSTKKCIEILVLEGMTEIDAREHFAYNVEGSFVGEKTPIFCYDIF